MKKNDEEKVNTDFSNITPTNIALTISKGQSTVAKSNSAGTSKKILWIVPLLALVIVAAGVVFILPNHVEAPAIKAVINSPSVSANNPATNESQSSKTTVTETSPFQEAQDARARNRSQELLSEILKLQEQLEEKNILVWGADKYNSILDLAREGDAAYRTRDFALSASHYGEAQNGLQNLLDEMEIIFTESMTRAEDALNNGNSVESRKAYEFALLIYPENEDALSGLTRTDTLDDVLALITEGKNLQQNNDFEEARAKYQQALDLDKQTQSAKEQIKLVNQLITNRDFNNLMSEGYRHLQQNNLEKARVSFQRASKLKPNSVEAASAINQTKTSIINQKINENIDNAVQMERQEKWAEAVTEYDKALVLDSNLSQAQEGKQFSQGRVNLDNRLKEIIAQPARLSNKAVYEESRLIYQNAASISNPQPRLTEQLKILSSLLENALDPIQIIFKSDNVTNVTINKIGALGKFEEQSVTLLAGSYVATGTREGYRDVRVEFTLQAGQASGQNIIISAIDKVASK
ncbi:MAG: hypothetical protein ACI9XC_000719 [Gammaproteobacteria bacterium]|jgi:hypothetical protein